MESNTIDAFEQNLNLSEDFVQDKSVYVLDLISSSLLPEQVTGFDEPLNENNFKEHVRKLETNLIQTTQLISNIKNKALTKDIIVKAIILVGENIAIEPWSNSKNVIAFSTFLHKVVELSGYQSLGKLLLGLKPLTFFTELRPKLLKDTWKNYPAAISCFTWILQNIKCPHLGDVFHSVLPTCLLLVDDYEIKNKIIGLKCLQHVSDNVSRTDLVQFDRGTVIYKAVEHMVYQREPKIIIPLGHFLVSLLSKTEHRSNSISLTWSHFDDVFNVWLPSMEFEQKIVLREAYAMSLISLLPAVGLPCARWSNRILRIVDEYCAHQHTQEISLRVLNSFMEATWPMVDNNFDSIIVIIMKVIINNTEGNTVLKLVPESTEELVKKCLRLLEKTCNNAFNKFRNEIIDCCEMHKYAKFLPNNSNTNQNG